MTAQEAARLTEDSITHGMKKIYLSIRKAASDTNVFEIGIKDMTPAQMDLLRVRGYHVDSSEVIDGKKMRGVLVSWDPKRIGDGKL